MKISTILDHIDTGHMALPVFQRGYVWNRKQVRGLMASLYSKYPVGSLLVWLTESKGAQYRGESDLAPGVVKLLLDGQQRITSLYGIVRGREPDFFDGDPKAFTGLHFHLEDEEFNFWQPVKMGDDPLWVDVSDLFDQGLEHYLSKIQNVEGTEDRFGTYVTRLNRVLNIIDTDLHVEEITGEKMTTGVVVDIFNRVNSGGTKLSKGDLALAKICAEVPDARERMQESLEKWEDAGFDFNLDWFLRCINAVVTGEAKFQAMHDLEADSFLDGLDRAEEAIDEALNMIAGRFGLDHDRVLFGRYAIPIMAHYLDRRGGSLDDQVERDKLLFWYLQNAMWGRYSGSTESKLAKDLNHVEELEGGLDRLIEELRLWRGRLKVLPENFAGWSRGARFYPMLYLLTRVQEAKDWGSGLPLQAHNLGKMNRLELHHIFPKSQLYDADYDRVEVNALANFCFLTKRSNLQISDERPSIYFGEIEERYPGALSSQWIPDDPRLWTIENYPLFLQERQRLLAAATNEVLDDLLHETSLDEVDDSAPLPGEQGPDVVTTAPATISDGETGVLGGVDDDEEETLLNECNDWVAEHDLPDGELMHELTDEEGEALAILDLAWPEGLQPEFSDPAAVLLNEPAELLAVASQHGYRCFTDTESFRAYVQEEILGLSEEGLEE